MNFSHIAAAGGLLATIALLVLLFSRPVGYDQLGAFLGALLACGVAWLCTLVVALGAANKVANLPYLPVVALHILVGVIGILGIIGVMDFRDSWWALPCAIFATLIPALVQLSAFDIYPKALFMTAFYLQCAGAVIAPVGYFVDAAGKAAAAAEYESKRNDEAFHAESKIVAAISPDAPISEYFQFTIGEHARGITALAAKAAAARPSFEKEMVAALHSDDRFRAMYLLGVEGVQPTQSLANAIADAIAIAADEVKAIPPGSTGDYRRDTESLIAADIADRFEPFAATLLPAMQKLQVAVGPVPTDQPAGVFSGRHLLHNWLKRHKG
ncbi:MAG: hypothetical protein HYX27_11205 [Acidobacteria bacterium]|nr:hypothetical protein [Acidobacteriota bacterium]